MEESKLNGSVNLLAQALRDVFSEAMTSVRNGVKADMKEMESGIRSDMNTMEGRLSDHIDTTNQNMASQFAEQEKKMGKMIDKKLARTP